jgi:hypothetical protein
MPLGIETNAYHPIIVPGMPAPGVHDAEAPGLGMIERRSLEQAAAAIERAYMRLGGGCGFGV